MNQQDHFGPMSLMSLAVVMLGVSATGAALLHIAARDDAPSCPVSIAYAPGVNLEALDVALIDRAGASIDMAAYVLTDVAIVEALDRAAARGVTIRLYRDANGVNDEPMPGLLARAYDRLAARRNVDIRFKGEGAFMHLKGLLVDGATLREGAANFSRSGLTKQDNSRLELRCDAAATAFRRAFETMWRR